MRLLSPTPINTISRHIPLLGFMLTLMIALGAGINNNVTLCIFTCAIIFIKARNSVRKN